MIVGRFSYAELPRIFSAMLGVTGTLLDMTTYEKAVTRDMYGIERETVTPSLFPGKQTNVLKKNNVHAVSDFGPFTAWQGR